MIVFFDVDDITYDYLKDKNICDGGVCAFEKGIETLSPADYEKIKDAEIFSVFIHSKMTPEVLKKFPELKLITTRSTGFNHIDLDYCKKHGIVVENVPKYGEATVAEFALGLCLNLTRKIGVAFSDLKRGICNIDRYMGKDLFESTLGVIGTGAIGRHAVQIAKGLGMEVIAYDLFPNKELIANGLEYVSLDELYARSDFITLHCPLTPENHHMINAKSFAKMKDGVIIINTARGELIDNEALYKALKSGKVGGAGLDALEQESAIMSNDIYISHVKTIPQEEVITSFINMKLLQLPNVIITPHIGFNSIDAIRRILAQTVKNIEEFKKGNIINEVRARD